MLPVRQARESAPSWGALLLPISGSMKIAAFRDDLDIAGMTRRRRAPAACGVPLGESGGHGLVAEIAKHVAMIFQPPCDDVDDVAVRIALDDSMDRYQPRAHHDLALLFEHVGPDDEVGDS